MPALAPILRPPRATSPHRRARSAFALVLSVAASGPPFLVAEDDFIPTIYPRSPEGELAVRRIRVAPEFVVELAASEPDLANPVAFTIDERGRFYVAETFRHFAGVSDNRRHMEWLDDDLAATTVADRLAFMRKHLGDAFPAWAVAHDRLRLLEDTDADGRLDRSTVFADGFHRAEDGIGAGVLARGDDVWYACIPSLWHLRDQNRDGVADARRELHTGYGVHVAFLGHDLHGLTFGPDGKLYFSVGDRGLHVETGERVIAHPHTGAVLRCHPDGSELEVFATGLRNPQELAFDDLGNLFTGENNSDSGDLARWTYLVEGSDSGWRMSFQYIEWPVSRGPWNSELLWRPHFDGQPAHIVPPILNIADGPAGLTYYPGTGLSERYRGHFFLCDFRGDSAKSGVRSFAVVPRGAGFELVDHHKFLWGALATDVDFGPDGALYISDWVEGWDKPGKGRIYRVRPREANREAESVRQLLARGTDDASSTELATRLEHSDRRVRQAAQFALASRELDALPILERVLASTKPLVARVHALWAIGQMLDRHPELGSVVAGVADDAHGEIRAQALRVLRWGSDPGAREAFRRGLEDALPRVQFFAAQGLARTGDGSDADRVARMLDANRGEDPFLRHAGVMALAGIGERNPKALEAIYSHPAKAVRVAVVVALRRLASPAVRRFVRDRESDVAAEAIRAVHDVPIPSALDSVAAVPLTGAAATGLSESVAHRVLNARFRRGGRENARAIARAANSDDLAETLRREALRMLADWRAPSGRDRVLSLWRPIPPRDGAPAATALEEILPTVLARAPSAVLADAVAAARTVDSPAIAASLRAVLARRGAPGEVRVSALRALAAADSVSTRDRSQIVGDALTDDHGAVRAAALHLFAKGATRDETIAECRRSLLDGDDHVRQAAFEILGSVATPEVDSLIASEVRSLREEKAPRAYALELLETARARAQSVPAIATELESYEAWKAAAGRTATFDDTLIGGDAERGREIFYSKAEVSCLRCHRIGGDGGEVGPELTNVARTRDRRLLLEAIVDPNATIAEGFDSVTLVLDTGEDISGVLQSEDAESIRIVTPERTPRTVFKSRVIDRTKAVSAMPEDLVQFLTRRELRDLVAFLVELK